MKKFEKYDVKPMEQISCSYTSKPDHFVLFFTQLRAKFSIICLSKNCARDMGLDIDDFVTILNGMIIDLESLKPFAKEAYIVNKLIEHYQKHGTVLNTEEISPEIEEVFKKSFILTTWIMSCYILNLKHYFKIVRSSCISNFNAINIPTRGMIQFLLVQMAGTALSLMAIQSHATCVIDTEQKINSATSTLTPIIDQIYKFARKSLLLANIMLKKTCWWYKLLYQYSCKIPCADDHLRFWHNADYQSYIEKAQYGPFQLRKLIRRPEKFFKIVTQNWTSKMKVDYPLKLLHIFGNIDEESDEREFDLEYTKNTIIKVEKQVEKALKEGQHIQFFSEKLQNLCSEIEEDYLQKK